MTYPRREAFPGHDARGDHYDDDDDVRRDKRDRTVPSAVPLRNFPVATPTAAFLTRLTKISTGHASPTAGAASAMLLILLIQVIGDGVTRSA